MAGELWHIRKCPRCEGTGKVGYKHLYHSQIYTSEEPCPKCRGRGRIGVRDEEIKKRIEEITQTDDYPKSAA